MNAKHDEMVKFIEQTLGREPDERHVTKDEREGFLYLPISHVESLLDSIFDGLWKTSDFRYQVVGNEIIGSITLSVFHPVAGEWIDRTGAASVPIQQKSGSAVTDFDAKIKNALVKDFPHLLSDCIKNAAKKLGRAFGRDLNRLLDDRFDGEYWNEIEMADPVYDELKKRVEATKTVEALREIAREDVSYTNNPLLRNLFTVQLKAIGEYNKKALTPKEKAQIAQTGTKRLK